MQETKPISAYKRGLRTKILDRALIDFRERGIRAVRMDDVAAELKISKRTLYEIFSNKELLVAESIRRYHEDLSQFMQVQTSHSKNVLEVIFIIYRKKIEEFRNTNPQFYADLAQYPQVAAYFNSQKERMRAESTKFFERGKKEGYFREDLNLELLSLIFDSTNKYVIDNHLYHQFTFEEIFTNMVLLTLRGICTEKGQKLLDQML